MASPKQKAGTRSLVRLRRARKITAPPVRFVVDAVLPRGMLSVLSGKDDRGKTLLALEMARAVLRGKHFLRKFPVQSGPVVALLLDDPAAMIKERLEALGIRKHRDLWIATDQDVTLTKPVALLRELAGRVRKRKAVLIILDALYLLMPPGRETLNDPGAMAPVMRAFNALAHRTQAAVLLITHDTKGGKDQTATAKLAHYVATQTPVHGRAIENN